MFRSRAFVGKASRRAGQHSGFNHRAFVERLEPRHLLAVWAELVGDFTQTPDPTPTFPDNLFAHDGVVYFSATDDAYGRELWQFDGQEASRRTNIHYGRYDSEPDEIIALGDEIFFHAARDQDGSDLDRGLWKLGIEGVSLVNQRGLTPQEQSPTTTLPRDPRYPVVFRNQLYFAAVNEYEGGVSGGILTTDGPSNESEDGVFGGIWRTDGQSAEPVDGNFPGSDLESFGFLQPAASFLTVYQDDLYFAADSDSGVLLWRYDGQDYVTVTYGGVDPPLDPNDIPPEFAYSKPRSLTVFGNDLYFTADSDVFGRELWRLSRSVVDGVETLDLGLASDITPGSDGSNPEHLTVFDGELYFAAGDDLYRFDGQTAQSLATNLTPSALTVFDNSLFFRGQTAEHGRELWNFDGQAARRITDLNENGDSLVAPTPFVEFVNYDSTISVRGNFAATEDALYFAARASDSEPYGLWRYDGTNVEQIDMSQSSNQGRGVSSMHAAGEDLIFTYQYTPTGNPQAFAIDGQRMEPLPGVKWVREDSFELNDATYFMAYTGGPLAYVFVRYDSLALTQVSPAFDVGYQGGETFEGAFFFNLDTPDGQELGKFDGTTVSLAADVNSGRPSSSPLSYAATKEYVYFSARTNEYGRELHRFDGATAELVADLLPGHRGASPKSLFAFGDELLFSLVTGPEELWSVVDDTVAPLRTADGSAILSASEFIVWNDVVYFTANTLDEGVGLWRYDGTEAVRLALLFENLDDTTRRRAGLTLFDDALYFRMSDESTGTELWRYDGESFEVAADIYPGPVSSLATGIAAPQLATTDEAIYFVAAGPGVGREVWRFDGESAELVADVRPGQRGSELTYLIAAGDSVYFLANDGVHGRELWRVVESEHGNPDLDGDSAVGLLDLARLRRRLGSTGPDTGGADLDQDGTVDRHDLAIMARNFGKRPLEIPALEDLPASPSAASAPSAIVDFVFAETTEAGKTIRPIRSIQATRRHDVEFETRDGPVAKRSDDRPMRSRRRAKQIVENWREFAENAFQELGRTRMRS